MSIEVIIKNGSFLKKELSLTTITNNQLQYGHYENNIFRDGVAEDYVCLYNEKSIGRGFTVEWKQGEKHQVILRCPLPSTTEEITDFYACVERICAAWKTNKFLQDGVELTTNQLNGLIESNSEVSYNALKGFVHTDEYCLPCALYPLYLDTEMMHEITMLGSLNYFRDFLHEIQSQDYFFPKPMVYQSKDTGKLFVRYAITEDTPSIIPIKPFLPYDLNHLENEYGKIDDFGILLVSITEQKAMKEVPYDVFSSYIQMDKLEKHDAKHKKYPGITYDEIKELVSKV